MALEFDIYNITHPANYFAGITAGTIGSVGVIGNFVLITLILSDYRKRKPYEWLIFALAINDFLLCLNNAALEAPFMIHHERVECKIAGVLEYLFGCLSFHIPPFVMYHRYLSFYNQQKCEQLFTRRNILIGGIMLVIIDFCVWICPFIAMGSLGQDENGLCGLQIRNTILIVLIFACGTSHMVSYNFLVYCTYKVIIKIRNHKKETSSRGQIQSRLIAESREIVSVIIIIAAIPLFTQVPSVTQKMLEIFTPYFGVWTNRILVAPFPSAAAANPFVTMYVIKDYRKLVMKLFKKVNSRLEKASSAVLPEVNSPGQIIIITVQAEKIVG